MSNAIWWTEFSSEQTISDYNYLRQHGPSDSYCDLATLDTMEDLYSGRRNIKQVRIEAIERYYSVGYGSDELNEWLKTDKRCQRIKERYYID